MVSNSINNVSATLSGKPLISKQQPELLQPSSVKTNVLVMRRIISQQTPMPFKKAFSLKQYPEPLPSGAGRTDVFSMKSAINQNTAMEHNDQYNLRQYPEPLPSKIGEEDLTGGFRRSNTLSGQMNPLSDLTRGIIQIDGVIILFDAYA